MSLLPPTLGFINAGSEDQRGPSTANPKLKKSPFQAFTPTQRYVWAHMPVQSALIAGFQRYKLWNLLQLDAMPDWIGTGVLMLLASVDQVEGIAVSYHARLCRLRCFDTCGKELRSASSMAPESSCSPLEGSVVEGVGDRVGTVSKAASTQYDFPVGCQKGLSRLSLLSKHMLIGQI
ncbi:hypothetical protein K504DRAFT_455790 [Pleomassaria siparia CBS 279.74]|uniref:Uncharacterized protein n=1 Tax=Pleomassaria siparia CBS 279.74 TaxID=1314801 RepID=A0A6G1K7J3_9PLEO|nr:hypothetical protein K504DRAFT_455790 [Pleomassaria siparia CBS 279.74]